MKALAEASMISVEAPLPTTMWLPSATRTVTSPWASVPPVIDPTLYCVSLAFV